MAAAGDGRLEDGIDAVREGQADHCVARGAGSRLDETCERDRDRGYVHQSAQEVLALGTLIPNEAGEPVLHMHAAAGREGQGTVGCTRAGVAVWLVGEVVLLEILGTAASRKKDPQTGFQLLQP